MREPFKRAAKVTLSIRKPVVDRELRAALVARIKPIVEYLASELVALAMHRLDDEIERIGQAVHVAVSAFASEVEAPQQLPVRAETSDIPARAETLESKSSGQAPVSEAESSSRGAPRASGNGGFVRGGGCLSPRSAVPEPAVAAEQGSTSSTPSDGNPWCKGQSRYVKGLPFVAIGPGPVEAALGPDIARALGEPVVADRDLKPENIAQRDAKPSNPCSKCGLPGGRADHCGTGHEPMKTAPAPAPDVYGAAKSRVTAQKSCRNCGQQGHNALTCPRAASAGDAAPLDAKLDTREDRRARIVARADAAKPLSRNADRPVRHRDDDQGDANPNADEVWTDERAEERARAEGSKHAGVDPDIRSSWGF